MIAKAGEKKVAKFAFGRIRGGEDVVFNEVLEESLHKVFGVVRLVPGAAEISVKRLPVGIANGCHALASLGFIVADGLANDTPLSGLKMGCEISSVETHGCILCSSVSESRDGR
jgi:hypothetical protein